ncbi:MAG: sulfurtransferase TusA family protein [Xanthomonadales bacterium]|nr:sulfurtransferase TusA family protein [Xanthomonadales bacterium]
MPRPTDWPQAEEFCDARGLICPEPVLRARQALKSMPAGAVLELVASDPHAELDFEVFCHRTGHGLENHARVADEYWFQIRRGRASSG